MRSSRIWASLPFLIFFSFLALFPAAGGGAAEMPIDLSATARYVQEWAARDAFPESTSFAYYNTYCQLALGGGLSGEARTKVLQAIQRCQKADGGFSSAPSVQSTSTIFTYYALKALQLLGSTSVVDREGVIRFIASLVQADGSIKAKAEDRGASLLSTYYGVASLALLNAVGVLDKTCTVAYIDSHRQGGGFGMKPGKQATPRSTFAAVEMLELLGGLTPDRRSGVVGYLKKTRYSGLQKEAEYRTQPSLEDMACVIETASLLSALNELNTERMLAFVASLYVRENGGFGPIPGLGATPPSTYFGVFCLAGLGKLQTTAEDGSKNVAEAYRKGPS